MKKKKIKICPKCNKEIHDSKTEKTQRALVIRSLKMIKIAGVQDKADETANYCYNCWKLDFRGLVKPFAVALGKDAGDW